MAEKAKAEGKSIPIQDEAIAPAPEKPKESRACPAKARRQRNAVTEEIMAYIMEEINQEGLDFAEFGKVGFVRQLLRVQQE